MKQEIILSKGEERRIVREIKYKAGYVLRDEYWLSHFEDKPEGHAIKMIKQAYNLKGEWVGSSRRAYRLIVLRGILPEKPKSSHCVCSIGYCKKEEKWYGWSHRAIYGFGYNDMIFNQFWTNGHTEDEIDKMPFRLRGNVIIKNMEQAKEAAVNFADYVS